MLIKNPAIMVFERVYEIKYEDFMDFCIEEQKVALEYVLNALAELMANSCPNPQHAIKQLDPNGVLAEAVTEIGSEMMCPYYYA